MVRKFQSSGTFIGETLHLSHGLGQVSRSRRRDPIRTPTVIGLQWLDEAALF